MFLSRSLITLLILCLNHFSAQAFETRHEPFKACPIKSFKDGKEISLASLKGKVVYLDFWASWCGPCALSFPYMSELSKKHKGDGLEVVAISVDESREEAEVFLSSHKPDFTIGHDPNGNCPKTYGIETMPTSYLIDRKGTLREVHHGFRDSDRGELDSAIIALLKEKP